MQFNTWIFHQILRELIYFKWRGRNCGGKDLCGEEDFRLRAGTASYN